MKKIVTLTLITTLILGVIFTGVAFAESPKAKTQGVPQTGTITEISQTGMILKSPGMDFIKITITTNEETKYFDNSAEKAKGEKPTEISWNDITVDDKIIARGKIQKNEDTSETFFLAKTVSKVANFQKPERSEEDKESDNDDHKDDILGTFKKFDGEYMVITHKFDGDTETRIKVNDKTQYVLFEKTEDSEKPKRIKKSKDDLKEGQIVGIKTEKIKNKNGEMEDVAKVVVFHMIIKEFVAGEIIDLSSDSIAVKKVKSGETKTLSIDRDTKFMRMKKDKKSEEISFSEFEVGDSVVIEFRKDSAKIITKIKKQK